MSYDRVNGSCDLSVENQEMQVDGWPRTYFWLCRVGLQKGAVILINIVFIDQYLSIGLDRAWSFHTKIALSSRNNNEKKSIIMSTYRPIIVLNVIIL